VGEFVAPDTMIGWHHETGQRVTAGLCGEVATMYFNPMHDSLLIMVVSLKGECDPDAVPDIR
jgi:hypothetical protein